MCALFSGTHCTFIINRPPFWEGHLVFLNCPCIVCVFVHIYVFVCVCVCLDQKENLYLTVCVATQKWVNLHVSIASLIWVEAIKRYTCCASALSIMAGSPPNVTFVTLTDSIEGSKGASPAFLYTTTCQSQQAHN